MFRDFGKLIDCEFSQSKSRKSYAKTSISRQIFYLNFNKSADILQQIELFTTRV